MSLKKLGEGYLNRYPDVQASSINPHIHFILYGYREGRIMFANRHQRASSSAFFKFILMGLKLLRQSYSSRYPERRGTRIPVILHWLTVGAWMGYKLFPPFTPVIEGSTVGLKFFNDSSISAKSVNSSNSKLLEASKEIISQASFEPALLAPGLEALTNLRTIDSGDLSARTGFELQTFVSQLKKLPRTVVILPHIVRGGADKYASNLIETLIDLNNGPVLTILTLPHATFDAKSELSTEMPGFQKSNVIFWRDIATHGQGEAVYLARFLNALSPENVFVVNSQIGLEALAKFGKTLSNKISLFVTYFSLDQSAFAGQYGVRFPRRIGEHVTTISDNDVAAKKLDELYLFDQSKKAIVIPSVIKTSAEEEFNLKLDNYLKLRSAPRSRKKWLWISRLDSFKGTNVLGLVAEARPSDFFDVYGPMQNESLSRLGLDKSNIRYKGELSSVEMANFAEYDGFLFTSDFEGLPLIVLEMTQHALPIISTQVGSLRNTFNESEIDFVDSEASPAEKANQFVRLMGRLEETTDESVKARLVQASRRVVERHSLETVRYKIKELLNDQ